MAESDPTSEDGLTAMEFQARCFRTVTLTRESMQALVAEIRNLRAMVKHLAARVAAQSELLAQRAEKEPVR